MSALSNSLTQINERKPKILIGNEELTFAAPSPDMIAVVYFGIVARQMRASERASCCDIETVDSLRLTRIDHEFNSISKDLLEKFRVVRTSVEKWRDFERNYVHSSLICHGFNASEELSAQIGRIKDFYLDILTINSSSKNLKIFLFRN